MKIVMINGSPHENGCTARALREMAETLNSCGAETEILWLGNKPVLPCRGCGGCRKAGTCIFEDAVNELAPHLIAADGIVFGSPVHYAAAGGNLTTFLDRLFYAYASRLSGKPGCAVVSCRRGGSSAALDQINKYFAFAGMPMVSGQYWNMVHGTVPAEVEQDEEGLQNMRTLGRNMFWLLSCIEAGKEKGIFFPPKEAAKRTNFIR